MDTAERALFADAVERAVADASGPALDAALADLGWRDALEAEPEVAVAVLFGAQGAANATSGALDAVLAHALGLGTHGRGVVLPDLGATGPPGRAGGGTVTVTGLGTATLAATGTVAVVCALEDGEGLAVVERAALPCRPVAGVDPSLGLVVLDGSLPGDAAVEPLGANVWADAVMAAQLALGHELVGAGRAMVALARAHALDRVQFDRPIAGFQAVRHRLAETYVALEGAAALLDAAGAVGRADQAAMAKAVAGRAARTAARHCQQVLAGIGFTTEHPFHRHVLRILVLDELFGSARALTRRLGQDLVDGAPLPAPIPL